MVITQILVEKSDIDYMENHFHNAVQWNIVGIFPHDSKYLREFRDAGNWPPETGWPCEKGDIPKYRFREVDVFDE